VVKVHQALGELLQLPALSLMVTSRRPADIFVINKEVNKSYQTSN
jgi:hypothetical protein